MRFNHVKHRKAFTLSELIITLMIIVILAGIIMIIRGNMLEDARKSAWESNMTTLVNSVINLRITSNNDYGRLYDTTTFYGTGFKSKGTFTDWARAVNFGSATDPLTIAGTLTSTMKSPWHSDQSLSVILGNIDADLSKRVSGPTIDTEAKFQAAKASYAISDGLTPSIYVWVSSDLKHFALMYYVSAGDPDTEANGTTPGIHILCDSLETFSIN